MPIVTIEMLTDADHAPEAPTSAVLQRIADALGEVFGSQPSGTWVRVRSQPVARYAENLTDPDPSTQPTIVNVLKSDLEDQDVLAREAAAVCRVVSKLLKCPPDNVHVIYEPPARGRVAFGGQLIE